MSDNQGELLTGHLEEYPKVYNSPKQNANVYNKASSIKAKPKTMWSVKDVEWISIVEKNSERWKKKKSSESKVKVNSDGDIEIEQKKSEESSGSSNGSFPPDNVMTHAADAEVRKEVAKQEGTVAMKAMETVGKLAEALLDNNSKKQDRIDNELSAKDLQVQSSISALEKTIEILNKQLENAYKQIAIMSTAYQNDTKPIELLAIAKFQQFKATLDEIKAGKKIEDPTIAKKIATFWEDLKPLLQDVGPLALQVVSFAANKWGFTLPAAENKETAITVSK